MRSIRSNARTTLLKDNAMPVVTKESLPWNSQAIQIPPIRHHASSNYNYYPELLEPYGITRKDWALFTIQFVNANLPTSREIVALTAVSIFLQCMFVFMLGPPGLPVGAIFSGGLTTGPIYYALKGHHLRHHVRNRDIPDWLTTWNTQYFNPKGLMVGFNLPGRRVQHAAVAPKIRMNSLFLGKYKKPKSPRRVAKKPRIVVVKLHDPAPEAGVIPQLNKIEVPKLHRCECVHVLTQIRESAYPPI